METGIYVRVSTEEQVKEGYSIRGQEQKLKDYARIKDWQIYDVYIDEGISGKNITARPAINRLIEDVKSGNVKNVLVFKIDRLTRSTSDLIYLIDLFNEHGCTFNSLMESIDTQTASGRMFLKIIGIFAEFERENISERIILGRERKVKEGYTLCSYIPSYGYDRPKGQKIQTINKGEAQIVYEIFDLYVNQGISMLEIAKRLNLRGVTTKQNSKWNSTGIKNVLKNNNYMGDVRHHYLDKDKSYTIKGQHELIIPTEMFKKAQHLLSKNRSITARREPKEENYFAGFLICAKCGYKMYPHNIYRKLADGTQHFLGNYGCGNIVAGACDASEMSMRKLEMAFKGYLSKFADFEQDNTIQLYEQEKKKKREENQKTINSYKESLYQLESKAKEALDCYVTNVFTVDEYRKVKKRLDNDKQTINAELERLQIDTEEIADNSIEIAKNFQKNWDGLSNKEKRMFLMEFVERIVVENVKLGKGHQNKKVTIFDVVFKGVE